jgi:radical SAM protein with 4Fe4S-binding SPASM domain
MCDAHAEPLTTEEAFTCITEFASVGVQGMFMSGGEPLLKKDLVEIIKHGTDEGIKMFLCTNATLMSEKRGLELKEAGLQGVYVGVEGITPEPQDMFYGGDEGTLERKIEGIKGSIQAGLHTGIDFCCTANNYHELEDVISLARQLGVDTFSLRRFIPVGRGEEHKGDLLLDPEPYKNVIDSYCTHVLHPDGMNFQSLDPLVTARLTEMKPLSFYVSPCNIGTWIAMTHNGDVVPCPYIPLSLGNMREESFKNIWEDSPVIADLKDKNLLKGQCGTCELRYNCGGCRASAYNLTGDYLGEDPNCWKVAQTKAL